MRGRATGDGRADVDRRERKLNRETQADTRPVIQPERSSRTKRQRTRGHIPTDRSTFRKGFQQTHVPHLVPATTLARRAHLDDEGRLQIRLQTSSPQSNHGHEILHKYRRPAVSGAENDVRGGAQPIAMERRFGDDHGPGKRPRPQDRLGSERLPLAAPAPPEHRGGSR
jgi:hypothetical protein